MGNMASNNQPVCEIFGDSGIDWGATVGEVGRLLASTSSAHSLLNYEGNNVSATSLSLNGQGEGGLALESRRRTMKNVTYVSQYNSQKSGLTEEQRARIEENRRRALHKKGQKLLPKTTIECPTPSTYRRKTSSYVVMLFPNLTFPHWMIKLNCSASIAQIGTQASPSYRLRKIGPSKNCPLTS